MGVCAYRLFGRCRVRPDLDVPRERENPTTTTPVHGPGIKTNSCRILFLKERHTHRLTGCQVVGAETEGGGRDRDRRSAIPVAVWQTQS